MALLGTRPTGLRKTVGEINSGGPPPRTGLIWWMNDGVTSHESHQQVPALNASAGFLGHGRDADLTTVRTIIIASNDRVDIAP